MTSVAKPKVFGTGLIALDLVLGLDPHVASSLLGRRNVRQCLVNSRVSRLGRLSNRQDEWRSGVRACQGRFGALGCPPRFRELRPGSAHTHHHSGDQAGKGRQAEAPILMVLPTMRRVASELQARNHRCGSSGDAGTRQRLRVFPRPVVSSSAFSRQRGGRTGCRHRFRAFKQGPRQANGRGDRPCPHRQVCRPAPGDFRRMIDKGAATIAEVQTLGEQGLKYRHRFGRSWSEWIHVGAVPAPRLADTCGSGDWCEGARGGMYVFARDAFDAQIAALLAGELDHLADAVDEPKTGRLIDCPACSTTSPKRRVASHRVRRVAA